IDNLQQVCIIAEPGVHARELSLAFHENDVFAVYKNVGDIGVAEERLERPEAENLVKQLGLNPGLFFETERHALAANDFINQSGNYLARLLWIDARELLQIQLRDQRAMYIRFVFFQIQGFNRYCHGAPDLSLEQIHQFLSFGLLLRQAKGGTRHLPDHPGDGRIGHGKGNGSCLHVTYSHVVVRNLPSRLAGEDLCNLFVVQSERRVLEAVQYHFEVGHLRIEEFGNETVRIAQFRNTDLAYQVNGGAGIE